MAHKQSIANHGAHRNSIWEGLTTPGLNLKESTDLIRRSGLDSNLLSLLGLETTDPGLNTDQDGPHSDRDKNTTTNIRLEIEPHKETVPEQETSPEEDMGMQLNPDEDQTERELEHLSEVRGSLVPLKAKQYLPLQGMHMVTAFDLLLVNKKLPSCKFTANKI